MRIRCVGMSEGEESAVAAQAVTGAATAGVASDLLSASSEASRPACLTISSTSVWSDVVRMRCVKMNWPSVEGALHQHAGWASGEAERAHTLTRANDKVCAELRNVASLECIETCSDHLLGRAEYKGEC